jgi:hypothetical protein
MRSIRWSVVVFSCLAPLACAPHYDVGDAEPSSQEGGMGGSGGSSTTGGTGNESSGGSSTTGGSGGTDTSGGTGGSSTTGGSGGTGTSGGVGGTGTSGGSDASGGTGGSEVGGSAGYSGMGNPVPPPCGELVDFEQVNPAAPDVLWARISKFLFGEEREPPSALPEEATEQWVVEVLGEALDQSRMTSAAGQAALTPFMLSFLEGIEQPASGDRPADRYARLITAEGARYGDLFTGDQASDPPFGLFGTVAGSFDAISTRGHFLSARLFCQVVSPKPAGLEIEPVVAGPGQTRREALAAALADPVCAGCHSVTDPLGFPLEVLTPGTLEYRTTENGQPIDTSGSYGAYNAQLEFSDIESLREGVSESCDVARCFVTMLFDRAGLEAGFTYQPAELDTVLYHYTAPESPEEERFVIQTLLEAIVTSPSFLR